MRSRAYGLGRNVARPPSSLRSALLVLGLLLLSALPAASQERGRIVGRVTTTESGAPISEAQVYLPGSGLGSLTRQNGTFIILEVPAGTHEVRVERIGLAGATQQVTVAAGQAVEANFQLATQALGLDEIVVTGTAGAARRREVGSTINQINVASLAQRPTDATTLLQAAAPGIQVTGLGGVLGSGATIRLRGTKSVAMSNQPIIYIDGVRMQSKSFPQAKSAAANTSGAGSMAEVNPLNLVSPSDIERIEVIKGSAATTLYGTEASAGVIQIFTKKGSQGAPVWNVESLQRMSRAMKVGRTTPFPYHRIDPYLKTAYDATYDASVRGGGQSLQYFLSGSHAGGVGILPSDTISKNSVRGNFSFTPVPELQMQFTSGYAVQTQRNTATGGNESGITHNAYRGYGNYFNSEDPAVLAELFRQDIRQQIDRFTTGGTITYSPLSNLTNRLTVGFDYSLQEARNVRPFGFYLFLPGSVSSDSWQNRILTFDYVGTYSFDVMSGVRSNFSWGGQTLGEDTRRLNGFGEGFPGAAEPTVSSAATKTAEEDRSKVWNAGFFVQNIFDIQDRYFLTVGMRVDGNSTFGSGFGLQLYPKASASWVLSDESFWQPSWGSVKLRTAYGQSGRAPGAFDAQRTWSSTGYGALPALIPANPGSPDIGPEVTAEFEAGVDAEWLEGRLESTFTYYVQTTTDALFNVSQIPSNGFSSTRRQNIGKLRNNGIELTLNGSPLRRANWGLDLGVNISTNNSEVVSLGGIAPFTSSGGWIEEGHAVPVKRGRWVRNGDVVGTPLSSCTSAAAVANPALPCLDDTHIYGPVQPTLTWAPNANLRLPAGISLSAAGEFRGGMYMSDGTTNGGVSRSAWMPICWPYYVSPYDGPSNNYAKPTAQHTLALKPDTPAKWVATCTPALNQDVLTTRKADYFRLRTVSAQVPLDFAMPDRVSNSSITFSLNNSWSWFNSDWTIMDPEMGRADALVPGPQNTLPPTTWSGSASIRVQF
jgi:outer membrane receptor protein involved in Fe transport